MLPSLQTTTAAIPPVEVTAALTSANVVMQAGHITRLLGFIHPAFRFGHDLVCGRHETVLPPSADQEGVTSVAGFRRLVDSTVRPPGQPFNLAVRKGGQNSIRKPNCH